MQSSLLLTRLLENAAQCARSQIIARFSRDGDAPGLCRILELPMAAAAGNLKPSVLGKQSEDVADFHCTRLSGAGIFTKTVFRVRGANVDLPVA